MRIIKSMETRYLVPALELIMLDSDTDQVIGLSKQFMQSIAELSS